jgi:hypothetical protein
VRTALERYVDAPSRAADLRDALNVMAHEAREKAIFPEHLLVVLKDIWHALPNVRAVSDPEEQVRMLQRVVTMCIKEYYIG